MLLPRMRTALEIELLSAQYKNEKEHWRVIGADGEVVSAIFCFADIFNTKEASNRAASKMEAHSQPKQSQVGSFVVN